MSTELEIGIKNILDIKSTLQEIAYQAMIDKNMTTCFK